MTNLDFETYFESTDNQYYDPKYIVTILENILGNRLDDIKNEINNVQVVVSKEQITEYLEKKFEEEDPELKRRVESQKHKRNRNTGKLTDEDIKAYSQKLVDGLNAERYHFEPYTLKYFNKYSNIVKNKVLLLITIIEKIGNKDSLSIQDLIKDLDIQLDENGNILKEDIIRLITPTVYNINDLNEKITKANDLSTYLTFKMSLNSLYRDDIREDEIYPTKSLQLKNLYYASIEGNVPLSNNQITELEEQQRDIAKKWVKMLLNSNHI